MHRSALAIALCFGFSGALHTGAASIGPSAAQEQRVYTYVVQIDRDGGVSDVSSYGVVDDAISRTLNERVGDWRFEASEQDGRNNRADAYRTYLRIVVAPRPDTAEGFDVVSATTGPAPESLAQPRYPVRDQLAGMEGTVVLKLDVGADGKIDDVGVHGTVGKVSRAMAEAARSAAMGWTFAPETVGGKAVASSVLWPVCFIGAASTASSCAWTGPDAQRFSSKTVLTLDPVVNLVAPLAFEPR